MWSTFSLKHVDLGVILHYKENYSNPQTSASTVCPFNVHLTATHADFTTKRIGAQYFLMPTEGQVRKIKILKWEPQYQKMKTAAVPMYASNNQYTQVWAKHYSFNAEQLLQLHIQRSATVQCYTLHIQCTYKIAREVLYLVR